jgi:hypothetical protein
MILDLAEALGCTGDELEKRITERELSEWAARDKPIWPRRLELLMAQVSFVLAKVNGNKDAQLEDFDLFRHREEVIVSDAESTLAAMGITRE